MIKASTQYALAVNGIVIIKGSAKKVRQLRKQYPGSTAWNSPGSKVGDTLR